MNRLKHARSMVAAIRWQLYLLGMSVLVWPALLQAQDNWLQPSTTHDKAANYKRLPSTRYVDLGSDSSAMKALQSKVLVLDRSTKGPSLELRCSPPNHRYLMRSLSLGNNSFALYEGIDVVIVSVGDFGQPRTPQRSAVAICVPSSVHDVRSSIGFAK